MDKSEHQLTGKALEEALDNAKDPEEFNRIMHGIFCSGCQEFWSLHATIITGEDQ